MTIAVIGANGFVGTRIAELWHRGPHVLRPIVRRNIGLARLSRFELDCRVADATDSAALSRELAGCEAVVNCVTGEAETIIASSVAGYAAACAAGVPRFVHLSSASVHGQNPEPGTDERSPIRDDQWHWYNNAKVRAEAELRKLRAGGQTQLAILRPGVVWGPRSRWITEFLSDVMISRAWVVDGGNGVMNSIFVDNLIHAIDLCLKLDQSDHESFLAQDAEAVSWKELYEPICVASGHEWSEVASVRPDVSIPSPPRSNVDRVKAIPLARGVARRVRPRIKRLARAALGAWSEPSTPNPYRLPEPELPAISEEMVRLQSSRWRLPDAKARQVLGYRPPVSFAQGMEITLDWLDWAGYPVASRRAP
ncbi:MAG TPA: NAD-dependent epimerase/dehydratase family protein [Fimbriimonadaceae bacterium]|nr:NAD-dependent epimerase/dehydratase family protein [Fimbriimonadaceae bacterium]